MDTRYLTRQIDIIPMEALEETITIIGAGAIGSFTTLCLAKMGFKNILVYDFDTVSEENMTCQWYMPKDIGRPKVAALQELIYDFTGTNILIKNELWRSDSGSLYWPGWSAKIIITAVDSMEVRKEIWEAARKESKIRWVIDPRMGAEYALQFVVSPHDEKDIVSYEKTLYTDQEAEREPCTAKSTMYTASMIAGHVAKSVKDIVTKKPYARVTHWNIGMNTYSSWGK